MRLQIFNVSHGFCGLLTADNNNLILFDSGHSDTFRPSIYLPRAGCTAIETLVISNFDHDHVSDLHNVRARLPIKVLHRNRSLPADVLEDLKLEGGPLTRGLESAIDIHRQYIHPVLEPPNYGDLQFRTYSNTYPLFEDTNNLSVVSYLSYRGTGILIPGDLEREGWIQLLKNRDFRMDLINTKVFVASHHGRESGYCKDVFDYCSPEVVLISDGAMQYETQTNCYAAHATGLQWSDDTTRRVLTTRCDGHITLTKGPIGGYRIETSTGNPPI